MNKIVVGLLGTVAASVALLGIIAWRRLPTFPKNTYVGEIAIGGMNADDAARAIRVWWEEHKSTPVDLKVSDPAMDLGSRTAGSMGMTIDDTGSLENLPVEDLASAIPDAIDGQGAEKHTYPLKFKWIPTDLKFLSTAFSHKVSPPRPAKAIWEHGAVVASPEISTLELDHDQIPPAIAKAVADGSYVAELPLKAAPKHVPDDALAQIKDVVAQYSTRFPAYNHPRCSNIRLASFKLRGAILMPGETLSFNGTVGRRTLRAGFRLAGVYKNGKHDVGIGGGICQVSTTLYNACLLSDLKIRQRSNHSLPVAYVPLGRDATVDYGDLDLMVQNTYQTPIAVDSHYEPGRLTFRILGKKDPTLTVRITQSDMDAWDEDVQTVIDRHLKPGTRRILAPGSRGHAVTTFRFVYHNGKLTRRDRLGRSTYGGQARIVAYNPAPKPPLIPPTTPVAPTLTPTPASTTPPPPQ